MNSLPLFDYIPHIEHLSSDCTCDGKLCQICKKIKCYQAFNYNPLTSHKCSAYCKPCQREYDRNLGRKKLYGVWPAQFNEMKKRTNNKCEICGREETRIDKKTGVAFDLSVDHSHTTGKVRGLLCNDCNQILGHINDDIELLKRIVQKAEEYLNRNPD